MIRAAGLSRISYTIGRSRPPVSHAFQIAGARFEGDVWLPPLAPFRVPEGTWISRRPGHAPALPSDWSTVFSGEVWVGGAVRPLRCERSGAWLRVACAGTGGMVVGPRGERIAADPPLAGPPGQLVTELLLGPALLLALARRGTFALHASAVATPQGLVAFVGESGAGKSTLARPAGPDWRRVADDILPVAVASDGAVALPHYPQLKLAPSEQYPAAAAARVPLVALYEVGMPADGGAVTVEPVGPRDATLLLIGHTAAARLFPAETVDAHLEACTRMATAVAVARLRYPRRPERLAEVREAVWAHLDSLHL